MFDHEFLGNTFLNWFIGFGIAVGLWCVLLILRRTLTRIVRHIAGKSTTWWCELPIIPIERAQGWFLAVVSLFAGSRLLELSVTVENSLWILLVAATLVQAGWWAHCMVSSLVNRHRGRMLQEDPSRVATIGVLGIIVQSGLWVLVALLLLANAGVEITPLIAGLGVGGIAIALAVQTILGDLLASLSITLDKPFVEGDWLRIDDLEGTVEHIGVKSTRLRSVTGEQIVLSNADLLKSRVRNMGRMPERRALLQLGVAYETPPAKLDAVSGIVEKAVVGVPGTRFEYCKMRGFGDSALQFELVYFVPNPATARYKFLDIGDAVNRRIHAAFAEAGIDFAYPTRTVIVRGAAAAGGPTGGVAAP